MLVSPATMVITHSSTKYQVLEPRCWVQDGALASRLIIAIMVKKHSQGDTSNNEPFLILIVARLLCIQSMSQGRILHTSP